MEGITRGQKLHSLQSAFYFHSSNVSAQIISKCLEIDIQQVNLIINWKLFVTASARSSQNYAVGEIPHEALELICDLSKEGWPLNEITEVMDMQPEAVINVLAKSIAVSNAELTKMISLRNEGKSLESISSEFRVRVDSLLKIFPRIKTGNLSFISEIQKLHLDGRSINEISNQIHLKPAPVELVLMCSNSRNIVRGVNSIETCGGQIDQDLSEEILTLDSAGCTIEEICSFCRVEPALVKRHLFAVADVAIRSQLNQTQARNICELSKRGKSIGEISTNIGLSKEQVSEVLAQEAQIPIDMLLMVFKLKDSGSSIQEISRVTSIDLRLLGKILPLNHEHEESKDLPILSKRTIDERIEPDLIYRYEIQDSSSLQWIHLKTGVRGYRSINYNFKFGISMCEILGGPLIITGGELNGCRTVMSVDVTSDFAVTTKSPMLSRRRGHYSVYRKPYVYVFGGKFMLRPIASCERYLHSEDKWEHLPPSPKAYDKVIAVVTHSTLLLFGDLSPDLVQEFNLLTLTWKICPVRLPNRISIAFYSAGEVYIVIGKSLFTLSDHHYKKVKELTDYIANYDGQFYYSNCKIYTSSSSGYTGEIGSLSF